MGNLGLDARREELVTSLELGCGNLICQDGRELINLFIKPVWVLRHYNTSIVDVRCHCWRSLSECCNSLNRRGCIL